MIERALRSLAAGALVGAGCFRGEWLDGQPCKSDADCGPVLSCRDGYCGGFTCPVEVSADGTCPCPGGPEQACVELTDAAFSRKVDILFVVGNAGGGPDPTSPQSGQVRLAAIAQSLFATLDTTLADYRIGVTTTDNGNPWCGSTGPEAGALQLRSCREHLSDFTTFFGDVTVDEQAACLDACALDTLATTPTTVEGDENARARPWIEGSDGRSNLGDVALTDALPCLLMQGLAGCGFEQPLESLYRAIDRSSDSDDESFGFLRPDAHLLVVLVIEEEDCSYNPDWQNIFFTAIDGGAPEVFWSDPFSQTPTSAVCWNAGVTCIGDSPEFDACVSTDRGFDGGPAVNPIDDAVIHPVSRYRDQLTTLREAKRAIRSELEVGVIAVVGVPEGYPQVELEYRDDPAWEEAFGIAPGCALDDAIGLPPVRVRELAEAFPIDDGTNLFSICASQYDAAFAAVGGALTAQVPVSCMPACVADATASIPDIQPECRVTALDDDGVREIEHCDLAEGRPRLGDDQDVCYYERVGEEVAAACSGQGSNLQFGFLTAEGVVPPESVFASCVRATDPESACPTP